MKTRLHPSRFFVTIRLPEIITWIIGLLFFVFLILSLDLASQTQGQSLKDTVWLRTGEVIPCIILEERIYTNEIYVKQFNSSGRLITEKYPFESVSYFKKVSTKADTKDLSEYSNVVKSPKFYISFGGGWPANVGISLNFIAKNDMGGSISYRFYSLKSKKKPPDYFGGIFSIGTPGDEITMLSASFMKIFPIRTKPRVRFGVEGGVSLITYSEAYFRRTSSNFIFGPNYTLTYEKTKTAGLAMRARLEFPLSQVVGLEIALAGNINPIRSFFGLELYLTLGRVRDRIKSGK